MTLSARIKLINFQRKNFISNSSQKSCKLLINCSLIFCETQQNGIPYQFNKLRALKGNGLESVEEFASHSPKHRLQLCFHITRCSLPAFLCNKLFFAANFLGFFLPVKPTSVFLSCISIEYSSNAIPLNFDHFPSQSGESEEPLKWQWLAKQRFWEAWKCLRRFLFGCCWLALMKFLLDGSALM